MENVKQTLAVTHPDIAAQWHSTKNIPLTPNDVTPGSCKKVWWQCPKGKDHEYLARIGHKTKGSKCPVCLGKIAVKSNSLATTNSELADQWHPTKNGALKPEDVTAGTTRSVWWKCNKGPDHEWQSRVCTRSAIAKANNNKVSCPFCSGQKVSSSTSLLATNPKLAQEWYYEKNKELTPAQLTAGSHFSVWWQCQRNKDHVWRASIISRSRGVGCPYCSGYKVNETNSLAIINPHVASQWHPTKNGNLSPNEVTIYSHKEIWWKCPTNGNHIWKASVGRRTQSAERSRGNGCPFCSNLKTATDNCLAVTHPQIAEQWHPAKNGPLTPYDVVSGSDKKIWWQCLKNPKHEWVSTVNDRRQGYGCPYCSGARVSESNSLQSLYPELAKEWHPSKNDKLTPDKVFTQTSKRAWWRCSINPEHEWTAMIRNRTYMKQGCPYCKIRGWTIDKIRLFIKSIKDELEILTAAELYVLFQQNGLIDMQGKGRFFVESLKTGNFPKEELDKFAEGKPSLVDDLISSENSSLNQELLSDNVKQESVGEDVIDKITNKNTQELPVISTKDILSSLDNPVISSADEEAINFLITSGCAKIWKHAFLNEEEAVKQAQNFNGGEYATHVKNRFLEQYQGAKNLEIPAGYKFSPPNLMQRLVSYLVKTQKRVGNWSGTGAGKTLSAILASRVIDSRLTIICCPNSVVNGWAEKIEETYPNSVIHTKTLSPNINSSDDQHHYLILNYETFQQENSEGLVKAFINSYKIDFIVVDEIHFSKQRVAEDVSKRKRIISGMISNASNNNSNLYVLGMSATPVINNLFEGKTLLEIITGVYYYDLKTVATVNNCMSLYQKLTTTGIRWMPKYEQEMNLQVLNIDCSEYLDEIKALGLKDTYVELEAILTKARLPEIKRNIKRKTLIYTYYLKNIIEGLKEEIEKDGWKVAFFIGEDKSGLENFINGDVDVLIASPAIGTGVDGLQQVCSRLIVNILPWTHAEFEQLKGRIYRQGQVQSIVDVVIPLTFADVNGKRWSWCESKWQRIQFKKSIADAAVDGVVPEGQLRTPAQAYQDVMNWLQRLEDGKIHKIERRKIHIPLSDTIIKSRVRKFGDFSRMNAQINSSKSKTIHKKFQENPEEWELYHALYREERKDWLVVPYEEIISWCKKRPDLIIGDFGCGEAKLAESLENVVYSFDHIAINDNVIACDMTHVPLEDESLDVAVFSLSLMGKNFTDYIKEARRCLKLDGNLFIIEATSRFSNLNGFLDGLNKLGFDVLKAEENYKFTFIRAIKGDRNQQEVELCF